MKKLLAATILFLCVASFALAQSPNPVTTQPYGTSTHNDSGTIAATGTYQAIWTQSSNTRGRAGCTVQNLSASNNMFVFFGATASALTPSSVKLAPGQSVSCVNGGIVLQDTVAITGTSGDPFYAGQQ